MIFTLWESTVGDSLTWRIMIQTSWLLLCAEARDRPCKVTEAGVNVRIQFDRWIRKPLMAWLRVWCSAPRRGGNGRGGTDELQGTRASVIAGFVGVHPTARSIVCW